MDVSELRITAELANIELAEGDLERLGGEVGRMLEYFETMRRFETEATVTSQAFVQENRLRPDQADQTPSLAKALLDQAPDVEGGLIVIPNVL